MLGVDVVHRHGEMAVTVTQIVRLGAPLIDRQLDLEIGLFVAQIDERECLEVDPLGNIEAECLIVEGNGFVRVEHADHRVNGFGHGLLQCLE